MSGAVLNPWALVEEPRDRAFRLGAVLGCKTTDSRELVEFLRTVPAHRLVEDAVKAQTAEVSSWKISDKPTCCQTFTAFRSKVHSSTLFRQ